MKIKYWKRTPVTIRAACVGGVFVILSAILSWVPRLIGRYDMDTPAPVAPIVPQVPVTTVERARNIIGEYFNVGGEEIVDLSVVWLDLLGTGSSQEFYAKYGREFTDYLVVFSMRKDEPENLYFGTSKGGYSLRGSHATIDGTTYFLCTSKVGSGSYLDISVFDYDGIGKLHLVHREEGFFQGDIYVVDNRIYLAGNNQRYELRLSDGEFRLVQYSKRLSTEMGSGCHVLSYHVMSDKLVIEYDGEQIKFRRHEDYYVSESPIVLQADEQVLVDDNIADGEQQGIRLLTRRGEWTFRDGFFTTYIPGSKGMKQLSICHNYSDWYRIDIYVK